MYSVDPVREVEDFLDRMEKSMEEIATTVEHIREGDSFGDDEDGAESGANYVERKATKEE